jgi:hypothetical protein
LISRVDCTPRTTLNSAAFSQSSFCPGIRAHPRNLRFNFRVFCAPCDQSFRLSPRSPCSPWFNNSPNSNLTTAATVHIISAKSGEGAGWGSVSHVTHPGATGCHRENGGSRAVTHFYPELPIGASAPSPGPQSTTPVHQNATPCNTFSNPSAPRTQSSVLSTQSSLGNEPIQTHPKNAFPRQKPRFLTLPDHRARAERTHRIRTLPRFAASGYICACPRPFAS